MDVPPSSAMSPSPLFPDWRTSDAEVADLHPGDVLILPSMWLHRVTAGGSSSVSLNWWSREDNYASIVDEVTKQITAFIRLPLCAATPVSHSACIGEYIRRLVRKVTHGKSAEVYQRMLRRDALLEGVLAGDNAKVEWPPTLGAGCPPTLDALTWGSTDDEFRAIDGALQSSADNVANLFLGEEVHIASALLPTSVELVSSVVTVEVLQVAVEEVPSFIAHCLCGISCRNLRSLDP